MQASRRLVSLLVVALALLAACRTPVAADRELAVSAAISLSESLETLAHRFEAREAVKVTLNLAGSNTLVAQILSGAPADLFISADEVQMDRLEQANRLLPGTRRTLLSNRLVVVVPTAAKLTPSEKQLTDPAIARLAMGDPAAVPAGRYAARYLEHAGVWDALQGRFVFFPHVRAVLAAVESHAVDAGFVYATDARVARGARVAFEVPEGEAWSIRYPLAVLRDARHQATARAFADFLQEPDSVQVFTAAGFLEPFQAPGS